MKQGTTAIHEVGDTRHRIVLIKGDGTNEAGEWFPTTDVAHFQGYYAVIGESNLPQGVFRAKVVAYQVLVG